MEIEFKDGKKFEFKKYGNIWLANNVIWEGTELHGSLDELRELKAKITKWFEENAPEEIEDRFTARLPMWKEIENLPFKDQIAFGEGRTDQIEKYFLGDEDGTRPSSCRAYFHLDYYGKWSCSVDVSVGSLSSAIRLCLEEK